MRNRTGLIAHGLPQEIFCLRRVDPAHAQNPAAARVKEDTALATASGQDGCSQELDANAQTEEAQAHDDERR